MPRVIVKIKESYFEFSTVVDAPVTPPMSLDVFKRYYQIEYGKKGSSDLDERLKRVEQFGTSCVNSKSAKELLAYNRAGKNETHLSWKKFIEWVDTETVL